MMKETNAKTSEPRPNASQLLWQNCEIGVVYHFDTTTYMNFDDSGHSAKKPILPPEKYNPEKLDTDQWLESAAEAGAKYAILTATHESGFLQWQSDIYPYGVKQSSWRGGKGDLVYDFVSSCRKHKILPGIYLGLRHNAFLGMNSFKTIGNSNLSQIQYLEICEKMVEEICSRYGKLLELWFDGGVLSPEEGGPDLLPIVEKHQPDIVYYHSNQRRDHRWIGNEGGRASYNCWSTVSDIRETKGPGDPDGKIWMPAMCDTPLRRGKWFWQPNQDELVASPEKLLEMYYNSVGRNCNLVLGLAPDRKGLLPHTDTRMLKLFGDKIKEIFRKTDFSTGGDGEKIILTLPTPATITHIVIMEDIAFGEKVRQYNVEILGSNGDSKEIAAGSSIGHKRIHKMQPVEAKEVRLHCRGSSCPRIKKLAVY